MGITPAVITAGASLFGAGMSLFGSSNSGSPPPAPPPSYQPQNLPGADSNAYGFINSLGTQNYYSAQGGQYGNIAQNLVNNPYASSLQGGANAIAPQAYGAGGQQIGAGSNLINAGQSYLPYAQQALATGFDPMNAVYNQQSQQNTDATRAALAARGINMSPYGAGVENQSNLNFNNAWLQNSLQRQQTAAGTANTLTGAANSAGTTGAGLQNGGLNTMQLGASLPYSTYNTIGNNALGTLGQYGQFGQAGANQSNQQIADYLQYLGIGNQSAGVQNQAYANQLTAQNNQFNQGQTVGQNLGKSISGIAPLFGSGSQGNGNFTTFNAPGYSFPMAS